MDRLVWVVKRAGQLSDPGIVVDVLGSCDYRLPTWSHCEHLRWQVRHGLHWETQFEIEGLPLVGDILGDDGHRGKVKVRHLELEDREHPEEGEEVH